MNHPRILLSLLAVIVAPTTTAAQPTTIELTGVVRDFKRAHLDFDVLPIGGPGHYAGNVDVAISPRRVPVFAGGGFKVAEQWQMAGSHSIAPHMYVAAGGGTLELVDSPQFDNSPTIDTFDSSLPYGGENVGPAPDFATGATMPDVTVPSGLPWTAELIYNGGGTSTLSSSVHCDKFELNDYHTLQISGNVVIVANELLKMTNDGVVKLLPGATLELYALKDIRFTDDVDVNVNTANPSLVTVYSLGASSHFDISDDTRVYAQIVAPDGNLLIEDDSNLYGGYIGKSIQVKNTGGLHIDTSGGSAMTACGVPLNDTEGTAGITGDAAITSSTTFAQWYRDILGVNLATRHSISLTLGDKGVYEYLDDEFYPVDQRLFGNGGDVHNNFFTYTVEAYFEYSACTGQFIEFMGADDAWIYIDGSMVIDLGGIAAATDQRIDLGRLGLIDGETYTMQLFFAHRAEGGSQFNLRTNVELGNDYVVLSVNLPWD